MQLIGVLVAPANDFVEMTVHESCCVGVQRHSPTYVKRIAFQDGHETMFQVTLKQIWYLVFRDRMEASRIVVSVTSVSEA